MSGIDITLDSIKGQLNDLRAEFTQARKRGIDVTIPHLLFLGVPAKIAVVAATQSYADLKNLIAQIEEVKKELREAKGELEIPQPPSMNASGDTSSRIQALFLDAQQALRGNDRLRMGNAYSELRALYPNAPIEMKKEMYKKTLELYEQLKGAPKTT